MATLTDLAKLNGVLLAFEFAPDGRLLAHEASAEAPPSMAEMVAQFRRAVE